MIKIATILTEVLKPLGFKRTGMSWLRNKNGLLTQISFYASQFGGHGYIDVSLTISDVPIEKQSMGDWEATQRLYNLVQSGPEIRDLLKKELEHHEAARLRAVLKEEAVPLIERIADPAHAQEIVSSGNWFTRNRFLDRLGELLADSSKTKRTA